MADVDSLMAELGLGNDARHYQGDETQVDALLGEIGLTGAVGHMGANHFGPGTSSGPGAMGFGPGVSSGPGKVSYGQGITTNMGAGRGRALATHTPDGRAITYAGPPCYACHQPIIEAIVNAVGHTYHRDCFVCKVCQKPFPSGSFLESNNEPYCEHCFHETQGARCRNCQQPIKDQSVTAAGNTYHPNHFSCAGCGTNLVGQKYREDDGDVFCLVCKEARKKRLPPKAQICTKCKQPIMGEHITLLGQRMCAEHFRCEECGCEFKNGNCQEFEGHLYCMDDYRKLMQQICHYCQKPCMGRSITALGKVWHPHHFVCTHCREPFQSLNYMEMDGKPYCELHWHQLFGNNCCKCNRAIHGKVIDIMGKKYHPEHFNCTGCDTLLTGNVFEWEFKPLCKKCYGKIPEKVRKEVEKKHKEQKKAEKQRAKEAKK